ncbi:TRAP transporter small permease [Thalassospira sp. TSL5-1]|uniref:TRAP transporter small permease n=1 Tax=Thalassospira sp. TSL5-1 TaxID=1544451 RepID=UPI000B2D1C68|nr:TRAP transporter small permease [Thalassospira sp. TSL5-1]
MLHSFKRGLEHLLLGVISITLCCMVALMLWQVFTRYVLATPALFTEETLRFTMIWMALLGSAYCFGTRKHLSLDLLIYMGPGWWKKLLATLNGLISISFASFAMLIGGWKAAMSAMSQLSPIMQVPMGMVYLAVPVAACLIIVLQSLNIILILAGQLAPVEEAQDTV